VTSLEMEAGRARSDCTRENPCLRPDDPNGRSRFPSKVPPDVGVWPASDPV